MRLGPVGTRRGISERVGKVVKRPISMFLGKKYVDFRDSCIAMVYDWAERANPKRTDSVAHKLVEDICSGYEVEIIDNEGELIIMPNRSISKMYVKVNGITRGLPISYLNLMEIANKALERNES